MKAYLTEMRNIKPRSCLSKFRLSNHKLMIKVGRHKILKKLEHICQVCKKNVEDEIHFLLNCELYGEVRNQLDNPNFPYINSINSVRKKTQTSHTSTRSTQYGRKPKLPIHQLDQLSTEENPNFPYINSINSVRKKTQTSHTSTRSTQYGRKPKLPIIYR